MNANETIELQWTTSALRRAVKLLMRWEELADSDLYYLKNPELQSLEADTRHALKHSPRFVEQAAAIRAEHDRAQL